MGWTSKCKAKPQHSPLTLLSVYANLYARRRPCVPHEESQGTVSIKTAEKGDVLGLDKRVAAGAAGERCSGKSKKQRESSAAFAVSSKISIFEARRRVRENHPHSCAFAPQAPQSFHQ